MDSLKVRWKKQGGKGAVTWSPSDLYVELNGQPVKGCTSVLVRMVDSDIPEAQISFTLDDLDIDADTLIALEAYVKAREEHAERAQGATDSPADAPVEPGEG